MNIRLELAGFFLRAHYNVYGRKNPVTWLALLLRRRVEATRVGADTTSYVRIFWR